MSRPRHRLRTALCSIVALVLGASAAWVLSACSSDAFTGAPAAARTTPSTTATTQTTVTTVTTVTTTATVTTQTAPTTTQILPGTGRPVVLVGDMNTPEQFILGQLYRLALVAQGYPVSLSRNIGPTSVSVDAVKQGSLDIYPEYINVWDGGVVGSRRPFRSMPAAYRAGEKWALKHKMALLAPTPFSNTPGIAVLSAYAAQKHLHTVGDLRRVQAAMALGSPLEFSADPGGLIRVERAYRLKPAETAPILLGGQYAQMRNDTLQSAYVSTTDGQLSGPQFRLLRDPKRVFGFGNVVPVVSQSVLKAEGPVFAETINAVDSLLTTRAMRGLNAEVELDHYDPTEVARTFLQGNGILPPPVYSTTT